jgi:hypothetical protein
MACSVRGNVCLCVSFPRAKGSLFRTKRTGGEEVTDFEPCDRYSYFGAFSERANGFMDSNPATAAPESESMHPARNNDA